MDFVLTVVFAISLALITVFLSLRKSDLAQINGPPSSSWLFGHLPELLLMVPYGRFDSEWQAKYGAVYSIQGCLGEHRLVISDPKVVEKILNNADEFPRDPPHVRIHEILHGDESVMSRWGSSHRKMRRIYDESFNSLNEDDLRASFNTYARRLIEHWRLILGGKEKKTVDLYPSIKNISLEIIAQSLFGIDLNNPAGSDSTFLTNYQGVLKIASKKTAKGFVAERIIPFVSKVITNSSSTLPRAIGRHHKLLKKLAVEVKKADAPLSTLSRELSVSSLSNQMSTMFLAGQNKITNALAWALYELALHPDWQAKIREEIASARERGSMELLNAFIKETLRCHPAVPFSERIARQDTVLYLNKPITTVDGKITDKIEVKRGQYLMLSHSRYNRNPDIWGPNAEVFRPDRWLSKTPSNFPSVGPYSQSLSFLGGAHTCPAWKFAITEIETALVMMLENFEFGIDPETISPSFAAYLVPVDAKRQPCMVLAVKAI